MKYTIIIGITGITVFASAFFIVAEADVDIVVPRTCRPSYSAQYVRGNKCFNVVSNKQVDWDEARRLCRHESADGDLAVLPDAETGAFITHLLKERELENKYFWLGLKEVGNSTFFRWVDGQPLIYHEWGKNEPNNDRKDIADCGERRAPGWNDNYCGRTFRFICEKPFEVFPACPSGYVSYSLTNKRKSCIKLVGDQTLTWHLARAECQKDRGDLVTFSSDDWRSKASFIKERLPSKSKSSGLVLAHWIGFKYSNSSRDFRWIRGGGPVRPDAVNWLKGDPNNTGDDDDDVCGGILFEHGAGAGERNEGLFDHQCRNDLPFLCESDGNEPVFCPGAGDGWVPGSADNNGIVTCYKLQSEARTFQDSRVHCREEAGDLVSIADPRVQEYIINLVAPMKANQPQYWINRADQPIDDDGTLIISHQPNESSLNHSDSTSSDQRNTTSTLCTVLTFDLNTPKYTESTNCDLKIPSICQRDVSRNYPILQCPDGFTTFVSDASSNWRISCVLFQKNVTRTWSDARGDCSALGGQMFSFEDGHNDDLNVFVKDYAGNFVSQVWSGSRRNSNSNNCQVTNVLSSVPEGSKIARCDELHPYICLHWGNLRTIANLTMLASYVEVAAAATAGSVPAVLHDGNRRHNAVSMADVCQLSGLTELRRLHAWTRFVTHASVDIADITVYRSTIDDHKTDCLFLHNGQTNTTCCIEATVNKPEYHSLNSSENVHIEMKFSMDKLICMCPQWDIFPERAEPIKQETVNFLRNITTPKNNSASPPNKLCPCSCDSLNIDLHPSPAALNLILSKIKKELKVEKEELSTTRNKKNSAKDDRYKSRVMGYVGVALCLLPVSLMVAFDASTIIKLKLSTQKQTVRAR